MNKLRLKEAVIVEGRYDKIKLSEIIEGPVIDTGGFRVFKDKEKQALIRLAAGLDAMSPLKVLARGYSMTRDERGSVVTQADQLHVGDKITVTLRSGEMDAVVETVRGGNHA